MRSCVVIPTYNESENIDDVITAVLKHDGIDVLVVDDSSPDGTADLVQRWVEKTDGRVGLSIRKNKDGLGGAYLHGFSLCIEKGYEAICEMDADLSHDPAALPSLIAPVAGGVADLVIGSRYIEGGHIPAWSTHRKWLSRGGNIYARVLLKMKPHDATGGFRCYRSTLLKKIDPTDVRADGYGFQIEMTYLSTLLGARVKEVPISFHDRIRGESKMSFKIVIEALALVTFWAIRDRIFRRRKRVTADSPIREKSIKEEANAAQ